MIAELRLACIATALATTAVLAVSCGAKARLDDYLINRDGHARLEQALTVARSRSQAEQQRATARETERDALAEHLREIRRGLANAPPVATANCPAPGLDPLRLRLLRSALDRADRAGEPSTAAKR